VWLRDESGGVSAEYGLLVMLIVLIIVTGAAAVGAAVADMFTEGCEAFLGC
jgi:Flp pilus assembly pilin Flp